MSWNDASEPSKPVIVASVAARTGTPMCCVMAAASPTTNGGVPSHKVYSTWKPVTKRLGVLGVRCARKPAYSIKNNSIGCAFSTIDRSFWLRWKPNGRSPVVRNYCTYALNPPVARWPLEHSSTQMCLPNTAPESPCDFIHGDERRVPYLGGRGEATSKKRAIASHF
jgi:hypothetical protein